MRELGLALLAVLVWAGGAQAKRQETFAYPYARVWTSAVRMLRVDFNSPITEKDPDSGYFLFDFPESGKSYAGSVEVVRVIDGEVESARVMVQLPGLPGYVEQMLLDRLGRKLGQEYGSPLAPKPAKPEPPRNKPKPGEGAEPPQPPVKDESSSSPPSEPRRPRK